MFGGAAGTDLTISRDPVEAFGVGGASLLASILGPKAAAKALWKENGYLSQGLTDLTKEAVPGLTRQKLLSEILRNAGTQTANNSTD